jgi:flavin-binding protein dodecin
MLKRGYMKKFIAILTMITLYSCASQTAYVPATNGNDYGYTESRITENRYRIDFRGDSRTSSNDVKDMALLRASELTLLHDYDWFRVVSQDTQQNITTTPEATNRVTSGRQVYRDCGLLGCTTTVTPAYSGIDVITVQEVDRFTTSIEIVMGRGELEDSTTAYDASQLRRNLASRY